MSQASSSSNLYASTSRWQPTRFISPIATPSVPSVPSTPMPPVMAEGRWRHHAIPSPALPTQPSLFGTPLAPPPPAQQRTSSVGPIRSQPLRARQAAQPGATFRWSAKRYFLTYAQIGDRPSDMVREFFENCNPKPSTWKVAVESHQDGGKHWHVIVQFDQAIRSRRADLFDIDGLHPNVVTLKSHRDLLTRWEYIHKEEGAEIFGPWQGPSGNAEVQDLKEGKRDERFVYIRSATTRDDFEDRAKELAPYEWIIHHDKFMSFADKHWKAQRPAYESKWTEFPRLPATLAEWASGEMKNPDRPKTLCVWGPSRTGKTEWARSLGPHIYMNGQLNAAKLFELDGDQEPEYLVARRHGHRPLLYMRKRTVFWGKPCIWLNNKNPLNTTVHDVDWLKANTVVYNLDHPLYNDPAPPNPPPVVPTPDLGEPIVWVPTPPPVLHHPQPIAAPTVYLEDLYPNWPRLRN
ncbi:hypothetical protein F5J12DRAFT_789200 [Pisolithus orientalis]|uniref:uncharacterized protein n=1 Tax=Pisolithus orientalis TaxID=936130 RepID=UPI0022248F4D|nr:uncharacterized protein F5J12DRAFT_789200 [Pisolithus orientalis]KAI5980475.1 hypothetical protein F5J12DRAFT_789200 [Pisolithus orientalis]